VSVIEAPPGLAGVVVAETEIGDVRGQEGFFHYREYDAVELAEKRSLEDVWHLLFHGSLPSASELEEFRRQLEPLRRIPPTLAEALPSVAALRKDEFDPLASLRTAVSMLGAALGFEPSYDVDADTLRENALATSAVVPTLLTALYRLGRGLEPVEPRPDLTHAENYLYMMTGETPSPEHARAVEQYMILTIDHGFNSSTFTARVITSTGADLAAAVVGAIGALSGPLHGGAPSRALAMLDAIETPENAEAWVRDTIERGARLMGFGHRVYRTEDPRSAMLRRIAESLGGDLVEFAKLVERTALRLLGELKPGRELYTNVEFYAGVVMKEAGVPREMFTPTFVSSRVIGWSAQILEQAAHNRLVRPLARYVGPTPPQPVPALAR
jgi:citrate synthase